MFHIFSVINAGSASLDARDETEMIHHIFVPFVLVQFDYVTDALWSVKNLFERIMHGSTDGKIMDGNFIKYVASSWFCK